MAEPVYDYEILRIAIAKEVEAYNFYLALADYVKDQNTRIAFESMAQEELVHKDKLELELMKIGRTTEVEQNPLRPERSYIISNSPEPLDIDYKDMLLLAIEKEEAAFKMYVKMAEGVKDEKSREMILSLAQEEVKHKLRFQIEYDALLKGKDK
jgi:rubrerythrin